MRHLLIPVSFLALTCIGCTFQRDLVASNQVTVNSDAGSNAMMVGPSVVAEGNTLRISGAVIRKPGNDTPMQGYVQISEVNRSGESSDLASASLNPRRIPVDGDRQSTFEFVSLGIPEKGTTIKAVFVDELHPTIDYLTGLGSEAGGGAAESRSGGGGGHVASGGPKTLGAPRSGSSGGHGGGRH